MKGSHLLNLVCVALIAGYIGAKSQRKKDQHELDQALNETGAEILERIEKEASKIKNKTKGFQPEVALRSRLEAEDTLDCLRRVINEYGVLTIADVKDCLGEKTSFRDNQFGWTDEIFKAVRIQYTSKGYVLEFPPAGLLH